MDGTTTHGVDTTISENLGTLEKKHHMRKRDTTRRCFICIELGNLAKNCISIGRIEDEKKAKVDNIRK